MKILIAEDDAISRKLLEASLTKWGYDVLAVSDGEAALVELKKTDRPSLAILDWMMPGMDGVTVCREVRENKDFRMSYVYIIMLTAKGRKEDIAEGLDAGADDYITKPFNARELQARVKVGVRMLHLQHELENHIQDLQEALDRVQQLQGLLPICSYCKKIRDDQNYWQQVESYIGEHTQAKFSHSICPECYEKYVKPEFESLEKEQKEKRKKKNKS